VSLALQPIGVLRTPYRERGDAPRQPLEGAQGSFRVELHETWAAGLQGLARCRYAWLLYWLHRIAPSGAVTVRPPWPDAPEVGVFASRSPDRPNPIGLAPVRILAVRGSVLEIAAVDALDGTPVLDIKPYLTTLDSIPDAGDCWLEGEAARAHLEQHRRGLAHHRD
jgi:tRNA-Thr(GGU) m(6)t(6)A37 methyltransferase TsaA